MEQSTHDRIEQQRGREQIEHETALRQAQGRVQPLYDRLETERPNPLQEAITEHSRRARAQGRVALKHSHTPENPE